uniref:FAS1-like dehydratase domain-containing protein n=1 Tax=Gemmatimonas sp. TaxID=1962908 RepID=UPI003563BCC7
ASWQPPEEFALCGMDLTRVLHAGQEFIYLGEPPRVGTELTVDSRIERRWSSNSGDLHFLTVLNEFSDGTRVVAQMRTTVVVREDTT